MGLITQVGNHLLQKPMKENHKFQAMLKANLEVLSPNQMLGM